MLIVAVVAEPRDGVDETLVFGRVRTRCGEGRLAMSLGGELGCPYVGYPDLHRPKSLAA
jgi:hypothetical protein